MRMGIFAAVLLLGGCDRARGPFPPGGRTGRALHQGTAMGSGLEIEVFGPDQEACDLAVADALAEIERLDRMMTDWKTESPLMDVNRGAGKQPVPTPPELLFLIRRSLQISELTDGAFDITFAGAGKLWNWRAHDPQVPDEETVRAALANVGWKDVIADEAAGTVLLRKPGMRIGLGAIAPGYAGDRAMERIRARGIRDACVNMSGDVRVIGQKQGKPWRIGIRDPQRRGENVAMLPVSDAAVSTSGNYERYFEKNGRRYGHIIDPRTGYPADGCLSATVVASTLAFADALATGVFVLGPDRGMELIESLDGVEGLIVCNDGSVRVSKGLQR